MSTAYNTIEYAKDLSLITRACFRFASSLLGKESVIAAFAGTSILQYMEVLQDCGFLLKGEKNSFFGTSACKSVFNLYRPLEDFDASNFDIVLLHESEVAQKEIYLETFRRQNIVCWDIEEITAHFRSSLRSISYKNFFSRLNINKLAAIALSIYLCPCTSDIAEIGAYKCGTTIFMAKLVSSMSKKSKILAFDTFGGIPRASRHDYGEFCFDEGMFKDLELEKIKESIAAENVMDTIYLFPGLIKRTLPMALNAPRKLFFSFVDTDRYAGTKQGLQQVIDKADGKDFLCIVGDCLVDGVKKAIDETLEEMPYLNKGELFTNFKLIFPEGFFHRLATKRN